MLKSLLKIYFASYGKLFRGKTKAKSAGKALLYALLLIYAFGIFIFTYYQIFKSFAPVLYGMGHGWLYFVYTDIMAFGLMCIFSVFASKTTLYEAKDNDLLLSMPIKPGTILLSRMVSLEIVNLVFGLIVMIPAAVAWYGQMPFTALSITGFVVTGLLLSLLALALSSIFGWLLAAASSKMRKKVLFETVLSVIFLVAYFAFFAQLNGIIQDLVNNADAISERLDSVFLFRWIGDACADGSVSSMLLAALCELLPFAVVYAILSATFIKTATAKKGAAKVKYVDRGQKVSSPMAALRKKEWRLFLSNSTYIINCGLGAIFILAAGVALLIYREDVSYFVEVLCVMAPEIGDYLLPLCMLIIGLLGSVSVPSIAAVSMEGRSLWLLQTVPVRPQIILRAKLGVSLWLYMPPVLLCVAALLLTVKAELVLTVLSALFPVLLVTLICVLGLVVNLRHPNLSWENPAQTIKRDPAVLIAMLLDFGIVAALGVGGWLLMDNGMSARNIMIIFDAALVIADLVLLRYLNGAGAKRFASLS